MHHILFSIALNLSKENISYLKLADARKIPQKEKVVAKKVEEAIIDDIPDAPSILDSSFMNDSEEIAVPYVNSNDFAELLSEDEFGNVVQEEEPHGPTFVDAVKNKLIQVTERKEPTTVVGSQVEGPGFFENIKNRIAGNKEQKNIIASEDIGPKIDNIQTTAKVTSQNKNEKIGSVTGSQTQGPSIISKILDKTQIATDKIASLVGKNTKSEEKKIEEIFEKLPIVGTLFESEVNQVLKTKSISEYNQLDEEKIVVIDKKITYEEDEDYKKFLEQKEIESLVKPEKIIVPNIRPRAKEMLVYKTQEVHEELLESRSFQNRHIPNIMQEKDREAVMEKIIEYGMIEEFRAFMNNLRDANLIMKNQYSLLTYATKYKQYDIMKYLIHIGADVNKRDDRLDTPLIIAVRNNDMRAVQVLINANANPNILDVLKRTPLIYAIEKDQEPMGVYLIDHGADVNITNGIGEGTLAMSMRLGRNMIRVRILEALKK